MALLSSIGTVLKRTATEWLDSKVPQLGAALAFYAALSLAPLLVLLLRSATLMFDDAAARNRLQLQMHTLIGEHGAQAIDEMIAASDRPMEGSVATIFGIVMLIFGASAVFGQLQDALNIIWKVQPRPNRGILEIVRTRLFSFAMVMGSAFLLLVSLVISAVLAALSTHVAPLAESIPGLAYVVDVLVSYTVFTLLFAAMYKWVPDVKLAWNDVWLGALLTAGLFILGKAAIGFYLGHSALASAYGVAGSFVVLLVWVYYSAQILFFGAVLTQVVAGLHGKRVVPENDAQRSTTAALIKSGHPPSGVVVTQTAHIANG